MIQESKPIPKFYPNDFKKSAETVLYRALGFTVQDIIHENCRQVYLKLVVLIEESDDRGIPICSDFQSHNDDTTTNSDSESE